jgi:translation initiation factor 2D
VKAFKPYKTVAQLQKQEKKREIREDQAVASASQRRVDVVQLYKPHVQSIELCRELGLEKDSLVGATKLRDAVNTYITDNKLVNDHDHGYINLNDTLAGALLKKGEQVDFLPRSEVLDRLLKAMQPWYSSTLTQEGKKEETMHKGLLPKVSICVKKRQGKKLVTIIEGKPLCPAARTPC